MRLAARRGRLTECQSTPRITSVSKSGVTIKSRTNVIALLGENKDNEPENDPRATDKE